MDEQVALMYRCRVEALVTEREGMIAENQTRIAGDQTPAFGEGYFLAVQHQFNLLDEEIRNY